LAYSLRAKGKPPISMVISAITPARIMAHLVTGIRTVDITDVRTDYRASRYTAHTDHMAERLIGAHTRTVMILIPTDIANLI
jgi:hypothetical protein